MTTNCNVFCKKDGKWGSFWKSFLRENPLKPALQIEGNAFNRHYFLHNFTYTSQHYLLDIFVLLLLTGQRSELHDSPDSEDGGSRYRHSERVCPGDDAR